MKDFDSTVAHAMNLAIFTGIIRALEQHKLVSPWTITEQLSLISKDSDKLDQSAVVGLELAQEWIYKQFTVHADPSGV